MRREKAAHRSAVTNLFTNLSPSTCGARIEAGWAKSFRIIVIAAGDAAEVIPRGKIRGGRDPLAGRTRTEMQQYTAHVTLTRRPASRVTARRWDA